MIVSLRLAHCITWATVCITLAGCQTSSPQVQERVIAVPSSKPYRYLKPHRDDVLTKGTLDQISRHNQVHWRVKQAEKKAKAE